MKATQQLKDEHQGILLMLKVLEEIGHRLEKRERVDPRHLEQIIEFLQVFVDRCHHSKEESLLFPALEKQEDFPQKRLVAEQLKEHDEGRAFVVVMKRVLENYQAGGLGAGKDFARISQQYSQLLLKHIEREDDVLFVAADKLLDENEQAELCVQFEKIEEEKIGVGKHEQFHKLLHDLEAFYLKN